MTSIEYTDVNLSESDKKAYERERSNYFKGTISVSVILGVFALGLFLLAVFNEKGRNILANEMRTFTVTYIGGTLVLIALLVIQIMTFKPAPISKSVYDPMSCPDYWKLQQEAPPPTAASDLKFLMSYKCVPDTGVATSTSTPAICSNDTLCADSAKSASKVLRKAMQDTYGSTTTTLKCNEVYPSVLADADAKNFKDSGNLVRCQYAKLCGIPWSSACPLPINTDL